MLSQLRKMLRHGFRDGSILDLLYHDGIVGYMAAGGPSSPSSSKVSSSRRREKSGGKQANATEDSNFFMSGFGGEGKYTFMYRVLQTFDIKVAWIISGCVNSLLEGDYLDLSRSHRARCKLQQKV